MWARSPHSALAVSEAGDAVSLSPSLVGELPLCRLATGRHDFSAGVQGPDHLGSNPSWARASPTSGEFDFSSLCFSAFTIFLW